MSLLKDIRELKTGTRELRNFGLLVGGIFLALGAWWWFRQKSFYLWGLVPGIALFVPGLVWPRLLQWVYLAWMTLALGLGLVISTLLLIVFFYTVVTPVGLMARLFGRDFLNRKLEPGAASYWLVRDLSKPRKPADYEQQF